ncbi:MAG: transglycosylase SLT domain-containing protein [Aridibacter sp.]
MLFIKNFHTKFSKLFGFLFIGLAITIPFTISCTAQPPVQDAALKSLREMTKDGRLPAESVVANVESRFAGTKTGALARLLRARIRLESGDANGAAAILDSDVFAEKTELGDYALWLRGKAFLEANNPVSAQKVFAELVQKYPNSMRAKDARLLWANSLLSSGQAAQVPNVLNLLNSQNDADALLLTAQSYEQAGNQIQARDFYRKVYFYGAGTKANSEAETKLNALQENLTPRNQEEILARANDLYEKKKYIEAGKSFDEYVQNFLKNITDEIHLKRLTSYAMSRQMPQALMAFNAISLSADEKQEGFYQLALGFAKARQWDNVRRTIDEMRQKFPRSEWTPKTMVAVGEEAGRQRQKLEENFYLQSALASYPEATEVAKAQFGLAWNQHELKNYEISSRMLTEHLARYVNEDNSFRGQTGYWAARDSERAGLINEACALYDATVYRYGSNWYGYLALDRLITMRRQGKCQTTPVFPVNSLIPQAVENLKVVTVAAETATAKELARAEKSEELSTIGLFDWAIEELIEAKKTADNSPKINLALAKHYRLKGDNVRALLALAKSYPDYAQMFPEEMGREEWDIFYPLSHWNDIKFWASKRSLDPYQVAGLIRQETIFNPNAASSAKAYGLMQLLVPTAKTMARKYSEVDSSSITATTLFNPRLNIELGTAYMRENLTKYGRIEYMAVAYNAGPGRVVRWRNELPLEMDEFVEEIPFSETRGYVKGVIRNSAQYRRLYDINGNFKPNVGSKPLRGQIDTKSKEQFAKENPNVEVERNRKLAE